MNLILKILSFVGLALTVLPAFFVFAGMISWRSHAVLMSIGAVAWFCTAPFWMQGKDERKVADTKA